MIKILVKPTDTRYVFVYEEVNKGERKMLPQLEKFLNKIPSFMFLPSFAGVPKPTVYMHKFRIGDKIIYWCHSGLYRTIIEWCEDNNVLHDNLPDDFIHTSFNLSLNDFKNYVNGWNLSITPYEYQYKAAWMILHYPQSLSELATRAGKTLIAYMIFRYMLEHGARNILMIVPSVMLVKQGVEDFSEYAEFFKADTIWAKGEHCSCSNLTIGTFQSIVKKADKTNPKYNPKFFDKFDVVCVDEAHHLVCNSINQILSLSFMKHIKIKFGFTGTLPEEGSIDSYACHSLMGPTIQKLSPDELISDGFLAKPQITQIRIDHPLTEGLIKEYIYCGEYLCSNYKKNDKGNPILLPKDKREFTMKHIKTLPFALKRLKMTYNDTMYMNYVVDLCKAQGANLLMLENMLLHRDKKRIDVMDNLLCKMNKNCIVFAHHTEYINFLAEHFKEKFPDKKVLVIKGSVSLKKRQAAIDEMLVNDNVILVGSFSCVSTGITFRNVDFAIFAQSFKSNIVNLQSIGRLMLKTKEKDSFVVYDMIDEFPTGRIKSQGKAKVKIYKRENFDYNIINT